MCKYTDNEAVLIFRLTRKKKAPLPSLWNIENKYGETGNSGWVNSGNLSVGVTIWD